MAGNDLPGRVLAWLTGILFTAAVVLVLIGDRESIPWLAQAGWISCALFLFMPAILLLLRPNLALSLMNILWSRVAHSLDQEPKADWQRLTGEEKSYLVLAAVVSVAAGLYVLIRLVFGGL